MASPNNPRSCKNSPGPSSKPKGSSPGPSRTVGFYSGPSRRSEEPYSKTDISPSGRAKYREHLQREPTGEVTVVSFKDALVRTRDARTLEDRAWLNDIIISFWEEYLHDRKYGNDERVLFVSCETTQCLKLIRPEQLHVFFDPLFPEGSLPSIMLFPLNDNMSSLQPGGTHWNVAALTIKYGAGDHVTDSQKNIGTAEGYCFDSMNGKIASKPTEQFLEKITTHLIATKRLQAYHGCKVIRTSSQQNGYDCGVHVCYAIEAMVDYFLKNDTLQGLELTKITGDQMKKHRKYMRDTVWSLMP